MSDPAHLRCIRASARRNKSVRCSARREGNAIDWTSLSFGATNTAAAQTARICSTYQTTTGTYYVSTSDVGRTSGVSRDEFRGSWGRSAGVALSCLRAPSKEELNTNDQNLEN